MSTRIRCAPMALTLVLASALGAHAQLLPETTLKPKKPAPAKPAKAQAPKPQAEKLPEPAQIVIETSPSAEVYLDDQFAGRASLEGRLVIGNPKAGEHALRVSLAGKKDFAQKVTVVAGQVTKIAAALADLLGRILIHSSVGAEVFLDSASRGRTDASGELAVVDVGAGSYELRISMSGKKEYRQSITVDAGQEANIDAPLADLGPAPGKKLKLAEGEVVRLVLVQDISSSTANQGDRINLAVAEDVKVGDIVVIAKGAMGVGSISETKKKGVFGRGGKLTMGLEYVRAVDGQKVRVSATARRQGDDNTGKTVGVALFAPYLAFLIKGKDVVSTTGTEYTAYVAEAKDILVSQ